MDHGKLTDSNGRSTDFRNVILIMTSNAGAKEFEAGSIGLGGVQSRSENSAKRDQALKNVFTPEFRNRLDAVVHFNKLDRENILSIVDKFLMELENQLADKQIQIDVSDAVREYLAKIGFDPKLGARPIARVINDKIKKPLAHEILFGDFKTDSLIKINLKNDEIIIEKS
jgi:ATP-dependent Clp protease ATP-binding subunit ClpA